MAPTWRALEGAAMGHGEFGKFSKLNQGVRQWFLACAPFRQTIAAL
jgi:hypothetical protein